MSLAWTFTVAGFTDERASVVRAKNGRVFIESVDGERSISMTPEAALVLGREITRVAMLASPPPGANRDDA